MDREDIESKLEFLDGLLIVSQALESQIESIHCCHFGNPITEIEVDIFLINCVSMELKNRLAESKKYHLKLLEQKYETDNH